MNETALIFVLACCVVEPTITWLVMAKMFDKH